MPKANRRILITRSINQSSALAERLTALGFEPILIPAIELVEPSSFAALDAALTNRTTFHWLIFTSANAVEAFASRLAALNGTGFSPSINLPSREGAGRPGPEPPVSTEGTSPNPYSLVPDGAPGGRSLPAGVSTPCRVAAIGPATARAAEAQSLQVHLLPPIAVAESLAEALLPHARQPDGTPTRFLLVRAEQARDHLPDTLRAAGAEVTIAPAYRTIIPISSIEAVKTLFSPAGPAVHAITFTSSSTATNLTALLEASGLTLPTEIPRISIGPVTSQTLRDLNLPPHAEASEPTIASLVLSIVKSVA